MLALALGLALELVLAGAAGEWGSVEVLERVPAQAQALALVPELGTESVQVPELVELVEPDVAQASAQAGQERGAVPEQERGAASAACALAFSCSCCPQGFGVRA